VGGGGREEMAWGGGESGRRKRVSEVKGMKRNEEVRGKRGRTCIYTNADSSLVFHKLDDVPEVLMMRSKHFTLTSLQSVLHSM
jgi:hypothetical protein